MKDFETILDRARVNTDHAIKEYLRFFDFDLMAEIAPTVKLTPCTTNKVNCYISPRFERAIDNQTIDAEKATIYVYVDYSEASFDTARACAWIKTKDSADCDGLGIYPDISIADFSIHHPESSASMHSDVMQAIYRFSELSGIDCVIVSELSGDKYSVTRTPSAKSIMIKPIEENASN